MAVLGPVVEPPPNLLFVLISNGLHGRSIRAESVGDDDFRIAISFQRFAQKLQCSMAIPTLGDISFQYFTFVIDGTPEVVCDPIYLHENLVQMPLPLGPGAHPVGSSSSDLRREHRTKPVPPEPHGFMADINATLVQQIFDVSQRQRKPDIHHHSKTNHFR